MSKLYDVIIIGAGPAGLSAGLYAGRARLNTLIIEKAREGGQIVNTADIANYPGSVEGESGASLIERMKNQAKQFGAETVYDTIIDAELSGEIKTIKGLADTYQAKTLILANGAQPALIGCPGEKEFTGRGVSYCATCDGAFFEDLEVYVVGGGDAAVEEAIFLTRYARKVTIIHRRNELRASKSIQEKAMENPKIEFMWDSVVKGLSGEELLDTMIVENVKTGERREVKADAGDGMFGVFVFIGFKPQTQLYEGKLEMENHYILTDDNMRTGIPGVFAAGDIRAKSLRQVVTATADGAIAATQAEKYLAE
ncbi:MAG TPA: thioredoxin-disulfide reductase [Bacillota bacterium]|nr:thioredoxin-disulfide reductase [Bacillota bacterium]